MAGVTNKGKVSILGWVFRGAALPGHFYVALVTSAVAPTAVINTFGELTEIADTQGYTTGGYELNLNETDFDTLTEDDISGQGFVQVKDVVWTATGGNLPESGDGARYAVLLDDNITVADRLVLAYWDLTADRTVSDGQTLTLQNLEIDLNES